MISPRIIRFTHQLLNTFNTTHLLVNRLEHFSPLLQTKQDALLDERKLDVVDQFFQGLQLAVCFGQERFLVFLAAQGEQRSPSIILS